MTDGANKTQYSWPKPDILQKQKARAIISCWPGYQFANSDPDYKNYRPALAGEVLFQGHWWMAMTSLEWVRKRPLKPPESLMSESCHSQYPGKYGADRCGNTCLYSPDWHRRWRISSFGYLIPADRPLPGAFKAQHIGVGFIGVLHSHPRRNSFPPSFKTGTFEPLPHEFLHFPL